MFAMMEGFESLLDIHHWETAWVQEKICHNGSNFVVCFFNGGMVHCLRILIA